MHKSRSPHLLALPLLLACLAGCSSEQQSTTQPSASSTWLGPAGLRRLDPHGEGRAQELNLAEVRFGQLVDVLGVQRDGELEALALDAVVPYDLVADGQTLLLERNPATGRSRLVVQLQAGPAREALLEELLEGIAYLPAEGTRALPADAVLVLRVDDLLEPTLLDERAVLVEAQDRTGGYLPADARLFFDPVHGGYDGGGHWRSTRVVVEPQGAAAAQGLRLRLATQAAAGAQPLTNVAGQSLAAQWPQVDFATPAQDLLVSAQVLPPAPLTQRFGLGAGPRLLSDQPVETSGAPLPDPNGDPTVFFFRDVDFVNADCAYRARIGDALALGPFLCEVIAKSPPVVGGTLERLKVRLLTGDPAAFAAQGPTQGLLVHAFDPAVDAGREACFLTVNPGSPDALRPNSIIAARFSEPLADDSQDPYEGFVLARTDLTAAASLTGQERVPARLLADPSDTTLTLIPLTRLAHRQGDSEAYYLHLFTGAMGLRGLGGEDVVALPGPIELRMAPNLPTRATGGHVTRFTEPDEFAPAGQEWSGQLLYDQVAEAIRPRPVVRFTSTVDGSVPIVGAMTPLPLPTRGPLNPFGSKHHLLWRYADLDLGLTEPEVLNLDVEGLAWAPLGGQVVFDSFAEFEMRLAHSRLQPDEVIDPLSLFPIFQNSGLRPIFDNNPVVSPTVAHPRQLGYTVNPGNVYTGPTGTKLMPYPLNEGADPGQEVTFTWRDTALLDRAGPQGSGVPLVQDLVVNSEPLGPHPFNPNGEVQSIGLPLLMEFRCYPSTNAAGLNSLSVALAANTSSRPYFRAFSSGGVNTSGQFVFVDPDLETQANGGFNVFSNPPGQETYGRDNIVSYGAADFVVRVSRVVSLWSPALDPLQAGVAFATPQYRQPQVLVNGDPDAVAVAYRGASSITTHPDLPQQRHPATVDATTLDAYGDHYEDSGVPADEFPDHSVARANLNIDLVGGAPDWQTNPLGLGGATWYQLRLTLTGDLVTGEVPSVRSVAMGWSQP